MGEKFPRDYGDIINLPYEKSKTHPHMSMHDRAAQFSPFAALTGHGDAVDETARLTERKPQLTEDEKEVLDRKLQTAQSFSKDNIPFTFKIFVPDEKKQGGRIISLTGIVDEIDRDNMTVKLKDGQSIPVESICDAESEIFKRFSVSE